MKQENKFMPLVQSFFQDYLFAQRGLSQNTIVAYRDALKLFFLWNLTVKINPRSSSYWRI